MPGCFLFGFVFLNIEIIFRMGYSLCFPATYSLLNLFFFVKYLLGQKNT